MANIRIEAAFTTRKPRDMQRVQLTRGKHNRQQIWTRLLSGERVDHQGRPSTTVVLMELSVVCSANIGRSLGASGAMRTRPEYAPRAAAWPARDARRGAESR